MVDYNGQICYASGDFVTTTAPEGTQDGSADQAAAQDEYAEQ